MHKSRRTLAVAALSIALVSLVAYAAQPGSSSSDVMDRASPDLLPNAGLRRLASTAKDLAPDGMAKAAAAPTTEEVGDVDSFGRAVRWLGVTQGDIELAASCPVAGGEPSASCVVLDPSPATTTFSFDDIARIQLPKKAANSLLCYWFSPYLSIGYANPTAAPVVARLRYSPTLTIENPVLDDPSLIDAMTGLPFNGKLLSAMTSSEHFETPLSAGQSLYERMRDSTVCIAGFLSKRALVDNYGLTEPQAREFFKQPTTVRLNVSGSAQYVDNASLIFGLRIVGD